MESPVALQFHKVKNLIDKAERSAGRPPGTVTLVAVSKTHDADAIKPALELGHRCFGENRVQEAQQKWPALREKFPGISLHLIGPLQSNKAAEAVALFDVIETVDREKIAKALSSEIKRQGRTPELFVQVNTGLEPQKAGLPPAEVLAFLERAKTVHGLRIAGLMCIPPADEKPEPHFALLGRLASQAGIAKISMGMSNDYVTAIAYGATHVRVGSAIFGARPPIDPVTAIPPT